MHRAIAYILHQENLIHTGSSVSSEEVAEKQADALTESVIAGSPISNKLESVAFNTIQRKPDFTLPPNYDEITLSYFVYVYQSSNKEQFKKIISSQIYRNPKFLVNLDKISRDNYQKNSVFPVIVKLDTFIKNLLQEDPKSQLFENRKNLLRDYVINNWLVHVKDKHYKLNYGDEALNTKFIQNKQDELIGSLKDILQSGWYSERNDIYIPSYQRSYFNSKNPHAPIDKTHRKAFTSLENSKAIEDTIYRYMPFPEYKDYIEMIYHDIPYTKQSSGISYRYFYFDESTQSYLASEELDLLEFDPYYKRSSKCSFQFMDNIIKIQCSLEKIADYEDINDIDETLTIERLPKQINISFSNLFRF
jgi:hypothetical protein